MKIFRKIKSFISRKIILAKKDSAIIIMVDGGFGSQLNKYFLGEFLRKHTQQNIFYDISWFDNNSISIDGRDSRNFDLLNIFPNINFPIASYKKIKLYKKTFIT